MTHNSTWVRPGDIFVAIRGAARDGHDHIADAISRGAVAVIGEGYAAARDLCVPYLTVTDARAALADAAAVLNDHPERKAQDGRSDRYQG